MEDSVCGICAQFEPQTWRKSLCKNCFHQAEEHTGDVNKTPAQPPEKAEPDKKQKSALGTGKSATTSNQTTSKSSDTAVGTGKLTIAGNQTTSKSADTTQKSSLSSKSQPKSPTKTTPNVSSRFGPTVSKGNNGNSSTASKTGGKTPGPPPRFASDYSKRVPIDFPKTLLDSKPHETKDTEKTQSRVDSKYKPPGSKEPIKDTASKSLQKSGDSKTNDVKAAHSTVAAQVSKTDSTKTAIGDSRQSSVGGPSKIKNLLRSFSSEDEPTDTSKEKKPLSDLDKHARRAETDVTSSGKCQQPSGEGSRVTTKTGPTAKESVQAAATTSVTGTTSSTTSKTSKSTGGKTDDGGGAGVTKKPSSVTAGFRGGLPDLKVGKTEPSFKLSTSKADEKNNVREKSLEQELRDLKAKEQELLKLKAKEKELLAKEKEYNELKSRERELKEFKAKEKELRAKEKEFQELLLKEKELEKLKRKEQEVWEKENEIKVLKQKEQELRNLKAKENDIKAKENEIKKQEENLAILKTKMTEMEKTCKTLQEENTTLKRKSVHAQKEQTEKMLEDLRKQLSSMEAKCVQLETDNASLMTDLKQKETSTLKQNGGSKDLGEVSERFRDSEDGEDENSRLKREIRELRDEMDEMYDTFRENELEEFRDLQKELEITSKNCRILQFKLRKSERRIDQIEADRAAFEERVRILQKQCESDDTRAHVRKVEDELAMAKEVSVRLHDELDLLEDKKNKAEEDSRHLTELLEQADKKQFRMEMEIDKLRDQIMDLKQELKYASRQESSDRKAMLGTIGKQSSTEYDMSKVMRDLYDSIERENDLKEQLKFTEEETKMMRKKLSEVEEENEGLNLQIRKMSRSNKKRELREKERFIKESEENDSDTDSSGDIDLKIQCELLEQELALSKKKLSDAEQANENFQEEIKLLQEHLEQKTQLLNVKPEPSSPNAYYEDKLKEMTVETDDLRWKVIEKEREIERLCAQMNFIQHSHREQQGKLKKSKSLDSDTLEVIDLRKQLEQMTQESSFTKEKLAQAISEKQKVVEENKRLKLQQIPSIRADDAAVENIELKDKVRKLDEENHQLQEKMKTLTECLQTLTKDTRPRTPEVPSIPESISPQLSRDMTRQLESLQEENSELRRKMAELESSGSQLGLVESIQKTDDQKAVVDTSAAGGGVVPERSSTMDKDPEDMTRLQLVEKVLDLEDEILDLKSIIKHKSLSSGDLENEVQSLKQHIDETSSMWKKKEAELVQDLEMLQEKNTVLSNLLEIVTERADKAEQELENLMKETCQSERSASQVSALSNASVGSDDVFLFPPATDKNNVIHRDWDRQMKKRVESLERLLAEERLKVIAAEKKLMLVTQETVSTAMSDDSKLKLREKDLLQNEVIESQKLLRIATDQLKGQKERMNIMEEEHARLKMDYGKVCEQLDLLENTSDSDKTPDGSIDSEQVALRRALPPLEIAHRQSSIDAMTVEQKCAMYKLKAEELQYKVEEISDIWRSKSAASEEEKRELEREMQQKNEHIRVLSVMVEKVKDELCEKEKVITLSETQIQEKTRAITRRDEILQEQDEISKQRDRDFKTILDQISQRDEAIRELRESLRNRDERLKEKDDILCKLNENVDSKQTAVKVLSEKIRESESQLNEKDLVISVLRQQISNTVRTDGGGETDIEKENLRLKDTVKSYIDQIRELQIEKEGVFKDLQATRQLFEDTMLQWDKDKAHFVSTMNIAEEKMKLYETLPSMNKEEIEMAMQSDAHKYFKELERLSLELHTNSKQHELVLKHLKEEKDKFECDLTATKNQLRQELDTKSKLQQDVERLSGQASIAYKLQQDERVMRAEYLAMKVRYETRFEKMSKDYAKMLVTIEKLQKERDLDKAIIQGIQKGMASVKDNYNADLIKWEDDRARLTRQLKEIDETREIADDLRKKVKEFKEQISEQDRMRSEMINKFATERSSWDIERANLRSKINQLEEKLSMTSRAQTRAKDIHSHMELAWETERSEQKRLLEKAHNLALDLQQQLKSRDEEYSEERRELLRELDLEQRTRYKEKKQKDMALSEFEACGKKLLALQKRNTELQEKCDSEQRKKEAEKSDLLRRLSDNKRDQDRDNKRVSDILSNFVRLRELGTLLSKHQDTSRTPSSTRGDIEWEEQAANIDKTILKYIRESLVDITRAADSLSRHAGTSKDTQTHIRRSLSSSEIDLLKEDLLESHQEGDEVFKSLSRDTLGELNSGPITMHNLQRNKTFDSSPSPLCSTAPQPASASTGRNMTTPSPSSIIPSSSSNNRASRPKLLMKSVSMDAAPISQLNTSPPFIPSSSKCVSASTTPTEAFPRGSLSPPHMGSLDRLSPRSARRKFFEERPVSEMGFLSWPERKHNPTVHHQKQCSLPDPSEVRKVAEEDYSLLSKSQQTPVSHIKPSLSWDEKMHFRVLQTNTSASNTLPSASNIQASQASTQAAKPATLKEKRKFFKKSSSLEGPLGSSLAKMGTQAIPVAAPTGFTPTDILATVRGKLKSPFKKSKESKVSEPSVSTANPTSPEIRVVSPDVPAMTPLRSEETADINAQTSLTGVNNEDTRGRSSSRGTEAVVHENGRRRCQSAERPLASKSHLIHCDSLTPNQVWQFSETAV